MKYDAVVIGSGVSGATAAYALKDGGKKVAIVEKDLWGGTCPNRGCDPKKVLYTAVEIIERNNQLAGKGFSPISTVDWSELMAFKRTFTDSYSDTFKKEAQEYGIDTIEGTARFVDTHHIVVGEETIEAENFIISTGQRPRLLDIKGKEHFKTSNDFLKMDSLPQSISILGAGYISFELAGIAQAAGSDVTIIHHNSRPLKGFDEEFVSLLVERYKNLGIHFVFDVNVKKVSKSGDAFMLEADNYSAKSDLVICATGRISNLEELDLEKAQVEVSKHGIPVNEYLQSSNSSIYVSGDTVDNGKPKLTPVSEFEGNYVAKHILGTKKDAATFPPIPSVIFARPKMAEVGVMPSDAQKEPDTYTVKEVDMTQWFNYRRLNDPVSKAKLVFKGEYLVGASVINGETEELINLLTLLINQKITYEQVEQMIFAYPTIASDLVSLMEPTA